MIGELKIETYALGDLMTNCYFLHNDKEAILIDPGGSSPELAMRLTKHQIELRYIINTHGHIDHIGGNTFFKNLFSSAKIVVYEAEMIYLTHPELNLSTEFLQPYISPEPDVLIRGKKELFEIFGEDVTFFHTPGHTPGSMCLSFASRQWLFCGDTLFAGSIGRTDLPGGSFSDILESLTIVMKNFPDETVLYPGHGPETTIGSEKKMNPYILEYLSEVD
jgi:glyoxylase-like metal-dependent hydrolase (beta-lactamase superfamily II)